MKQKIKKKYRCKEEIKRVYSEGRIEEETQFGKKSEKRC